MRRIVRGLLLAAALAALAIAGYQVWTGFDSIDRPLRVAVPVRFKVPAGARFSHVASLLAAQGIVPRPRAWSLYARWHGRASGIKAGEYEIVPGMTPRQLLDRMVAGQVVLHSFTIVDGWRVEDMLAAMLRDPDIGAPLNPNEQHLMARIGAPEGSAEGQFLPETYRFPTGTPETEILRQAHEALRRVLDTAWKNRDPSLDLRSPDELLTMASIVQKESGIADELPKIAGLYLHRLRIGMRLQADPTVLYGLGPGHPNELHAVDLHTDGPYNTYTRTGLPPTPIALTGAAAIEATAHPQITDALYFVASPQGDGSHVFSATLEAHNAAVARYLAGHRAREAKEAAP